MKNLYFLFIAAFLLAVCACKKEDAAPIEKTWNDVKSLKITDIKISEISSALQGDTILVTLTGPGHFVEFYRAASDLPIVIPVTDFNHEKADPFIVDIEGSDCYLVTSWDCDYDTILAFPSDYATELNETWPLDMEIGSKVSLTVEYQF